MKLLIVLTYAATASAQQTFSTGAFHGIFAADSGLLKSLRPTSQLTFDFSPSDYFHLRDGKHNVYHTGDITGQWRVQGETQWQELNSAYNRDLQPQTEEASGVLLRSNYDAVFPKASQFLHITRDWLAQDTDLVLRASVSNKHPRPIEIGAFGFPIEFDNIFTNLTDPEIQSRCVFVDPNIALDAGYLQVSRLSGTGPSLSVTPYNNNSHFEAWRFLSESIHGPDLYSSFVYEGNFAWQFLSKAYTETEWNATVPWNEGTSKILKPGEVAEFGLRFSVVASIQEIEDDIAAKGLPVAVGIPGYVLPVDQDGQLFLKSRSGIRAWSQEPSDSLQLIEQPAKNPAWIGYKVNASPYAYGRVRLTITYDDGKVQTIQYYITDSTDNILDKMSSFLFNQQWYNDLSDPFHRAPSVITYDHEASQQVLQDVRPYLAGLSDEGGAGSFEAAAMKSSVRPIAEQVRKLEEMVNSTIYAWLQDPKTNGVKRSLFFYEPDAVPGYHYDDSIQWKWAKAWNKTFSGQTSRAYNYVHVSALYWALYCAERVSPGILKVRNATWYLEHAFRTALKPHGFKDDHFDSYNVGFMGETFWLSMLRALRVEGMTNEAITFESAMKKRHAYWSDGYRSGQHDPYNSETAWDSVGEEGVYLWSKYFNDTALVEETLRHIRGYMPTIAHWGYNGNARRYWDFSPAGKFQRIERMIHHYASNLNALPLLDAYKSNPDPSSRAALYDLRVGYGGHMGPLSNVQPDGFASMGFHSWPDAMKWDAYSSDYGVGFNGHVTGACTFLVDHPDFGLISFGGNVAAHGGKVTVTPKDTVKRRIYVAPLGLKVSMQFLERQCSSRCLVRTRTKANNDIA